ncbi:MAG: hypothetical protein J2O48_10030, partial [Solirubrobacterales bacterium]|nr:hypothetical protein [Solirubrobacterales bacterium]
DPTEAAPADGRQQQQTLRRLRQLAAEPVKGAGPLRAVRTLGSNAHLLSGMVRANRPWRLATGLYRSMVAALAFVCFAVLGQGIWQLAVTMGAIRLGIASVASMGVMIVAIIWVHSLWERGHTSKAREQALLFNAVTVSTLLIGVATLYIAVMIAAFLIGELVIPARVLGGVLHRNAGIVQYIELAWLIASLATVGGALGSAVESETAIREATYPFATGE